MGQTLNIEIFERRKKWSEVKREKCQYVSTHGISHFFNDTNRKFVYFLLIQHLIPVLEGYFAKEKNLKTKNAQTVKVILSITLFLIIKALLVKDKSRYLLFFIEPASSDLAG